MHLCLVLWCTLLVALSSASASNHSCPTWFFFNKTLGHCHCGAKLLCNNSTGQGLVEIGVGDCATSAGERIGYYIGRCPFRHSVNSINRQFSYLPSDPEQLDDVMCGPYNRQGLLCGECIDGYGPAVYALDMKCANCSEVYSEFYTVSLYLLLELTPITLFFILLILFRVKITSGPLLGYIIFCQVMACFTSNYQGQVDYILADVPPFLHALFKASLTLCQFWSMHWFFISLIPPFCISESLTGIHIQLLPLLPATYPVVLVITACVLMELHARNCRIVRTLWKPFGIILSKTNITAVTSDAVIHSFASLIMLSYLTVYYVLISITSCFPVFSMGGSFYAHTVYLDPTVRCLSHEHVLYTLIAVVPFMFLTLIPSVLLTMYPTRMYSRCISRCLSARKRLAITAFAEALHSCFKDGLNGTKDYRSMAGLMAVGPILYLSFRKLFVFLGYISSLGAAFIMLFSSFLVLCVNPCKKRVANISISFHLLMIGVLCTANFLWKCALLISTVTLEFTFILIPLLCHLLVFTWAGYSLVHHMMKFCGYQFSPSGCRVLLTDLSTGLQQRWYHAQRDGYRALE